MVEILPSINFSTFEEVKKYIRLVEPYVTWVHIDVADGTFTPHAVWHDAADLKDFTTPLKIEIHFMVMEPEKKIFDWLLPNISRIIFHQEATREADSLIERCHEAKLEVGVAIRPDTSWEALKPFIGKADLLQVLAVMPGSSGQEFYPDMFEKIKNLYSFATTMPIEVDGGIKVGVARECVQAGATHLVAGAQLFSSGMPFEEALRALQADALS